MLTLEEFAALLSAIGSTSVSALTGVVGLVLTAVGLWWPNLPQRRIFVGVGIVVLMISPVYVWRDEYREHKTTKTNLDAANGQLIKEREKIANRDGQITSLNTQNQRQQSTINETLIQLGKAQQQEPLKISNYPLASKETRRQPGNEPHDFLIITNKPVTPVRLIASCDGDIIDASWRMLGTLALTTGGTAKSDKRRYSIEISSPPVSPTNPVLVTLYATQKEVKCSFSQS